MFKEYMHVERFGNEQVQGIELGTCYIFPKLDGTNSSLWADEEFRIGAGSRHRELSIGKDNAGFLNAICNDQRYLDWVEAFPHLRLYGEWLVPHTLKTYRDDAWRKFWVFDVYNDASEQYLAYDDYKPLLDDYGLDYVPPLAVVKNGEYDHFIHVLNQNNFFIQDGKGLGEGIVIKNYHYYNRHGNQTWAKIVSSEFKESHHREMGAPETSARLIEEDIADKYITNAEVTKTYAKITNEAGPWQSKFIPRLLETCFYDCVNENSWEIVKEFKQPTINYKTLKHFVFAKVKKELPEVF